MEEEFTLYQEALALKELGFNEPCFGYYSDGFLFYCNTYNGNMFKTNDGCLAPTYSQAFRFFREKYEYNSYIQEAKKSTYRFIVDKFGEKYYNSDIIELYEQAELACLKKLIEIVKEK